MKLSDLKTGMHVMFRNGDEYIVLKDTCLFDSSITDDTYAKDIVKRLDGGSHTSLENYNENFSNAHGFEDLDIVEVYTCNCVSNILASVKDEPNAFARIFADLRPTMTIKEAEEKFGIKISDRKED